ncbi:MAG: CRISPR-associated endonuclease Cas2 [Zoogloea sp.]|uniref:CRISPR-associated endonuclease Cas2 n=1 Tax=Zoogloea sp. TaxID=49181 RepID=UPI003F2A2765
MLVCYDIADDRRRLKVAQVLEGYGVRVQKSVFECALDASREAELRDRLARLAEPGLDRVRYYHLCGKDVALALHWGCPGPQTDVQVWIA